MGDVRLIVGGSIEESRAENGQLASYENMVPGVDGDGRSDQQSDTFTETGRGVARRAIFEYPAEVVK